MQIDTSTPVLVTGATGYVAGWVVAELLAAGVTVHAAVRNPGNLAAIAHLDRLAHDAPGTLRYFAADLLEPGSYAEAMAECGVVFHTASPFARSVADPQRDLVDPAVQGTRNVLGEATTTASVRRVVVTSSVAAMYTDARECAALPGGALTEDVWNTTASLNREPYNYSKTLAERAAWECADQQDRWDLVTINPSLVVGPALQDHPTSESFEVMKLILGGTMRFGAPDMGIGVVDVRDVAAAHLAAAFTPEASGRYIVSGHDTTTLDMAQALRFTYGRRFPLPRRALPTRLVKVVGPRLAGLSPEYIEGNVGHPFHADNTKSRKELGVTYRPLRESLEDMTAMMIRAGLVRPRGH